MVGNLAKAPKAPKHSRAGVKNRLQPDVRTSSCSAWQSLTQVFFLRFYFLPGDRKKLVAVSQNQEPGPEPKQK